MPGVQRRAGPKARISSFAMLPQLEVVQWNLGMVNIEGDYRPASLEAEESVTRPIVWRSWSELFETYAPCRDGYIAFYGQRFPDREPGIERLYRAWQAGGDGAADLEAQRISDEGRAEQRRLYTAVFGGAA